MVSANLWSSLLLRYYSITSHLYLLHSRKHLYRDPDFFYRVQLKRLKAILIHAYSNSVFYRSLFKKHGVRPEELKQVEDITKFPIISKDDLRRAGILGVSTRNIKFFVEHRTSGSTGIPLILRFSLKDEAYQGIMWARGYIENGYNAKMKIFRLVHPIDFYNLNKRNLLEISVLEDYARVARVLLDFKPDIIEGYPTDLFLLCKELEKKGISYQAKRVFTHSELLDPSVRSKLERVFGTKVIDLYGAHEAGCIAWQCTHDHYHVNIDGVFIEVVDASNEWVSEGEKGEILVTNLFSYGTPIIRYRLGDVVTLNGSENEDCRIVLPRMGIIMGKVYDHIVLPSGRLVSPHVPKQILGRNEKLYTFQVIQDSIDHLVVKIVPSSALKSKDIESIREELIRAFNNELSIEVQVVSRIEREGLNKFKTIISLMDGKV